jgi:prephenate dehydrogenase
MRADRPRLTVVGAAGAVGSLFARALREAGWEVAGLDRRAPAVALDALVLDDVAAPGAAARALLARSEAVMLCVPEETALAALSALPASLALLVDTLSVKTPLFARLDAAPPTCEVLSLDPMFAPSVGFAGQAVVAVRARAGERGDALLALLGRWGARVIGMSAEEHDRTSALTQAATHAALLALASAAAAGSMEAVAAVAPPPHLACLALAARIAAAAPETYWDIQRHNPHAKAARRALAAALAEIDAAVEADDRDRFTAVLAALRRRLGEALPALPEAAAAVIQAASKARR